MDDTKKMGAGAFAAKVGVTPETLRNWRRIGIYPGGAATNGRVEYSEYDVFVVRVMLKLYREMFELADAWRIAEKVGPILAAGSSAKYALVTHGSNVVLAGQLLNVADLKGIVTSVVSLDALSEYLREQDEAIQE